MGLRWVQEHPARGQPNLPEPEQVFFDWLMAQPNGDGLLAAASREAARLSRYRGPHDGPRALARLFEELIAELQKPELGTH